MRKLVARWLPPLVWMGLIFFVSAQPSLPSAPGGWDLPLKKGMHVVAYAVLTWLYLRAFRGWWRDERRVRAASVLLAIVYAVSDEYHQTFVPGRSGNWVDVMIDSVGILMAVWLDWRYASRRRSGDSQPS